MMTSLISHFTILGIKSPKWKLPGITVFCTRNHWHFKSRPICPATPDLIPVIPFVSRGMFPFVVMWWCHRGDGVMLLNTSVVLNGQLRFSSCRAIKTLCTSFSIRCWVFPIIPSFGECLLLFKVHGNLVIVTWEKELFNDLTANASVKKQDPSRLYYQGF